jgi:hypothetical protein
MAAKKAFPAPGAADQSARACARLMTSFIYKNDHDTIYIYQ